MDAYDVLSAIQGKIPLDDEVQGRIKQMVFSMNKTQIYDFMVKLPTLRLKSPALVFWVGSFAFGNLGIGRFMIGDYALGAIRLILFGVGASMRGSTIGEACVSISMLWWIIDLFIVGKKLRMQNLHKILSAIQ